MQFLKTSIFFLTVALFVACAKVPSDFEGIDGPVVLSLDPNISVEKWEYLSPEQLPQTDPLFLYGNDGIVFGEEPHEAVIVWTEQGFDLHWGEFPCATKPIVLIKEDNVIELFGGKQPPPPLECNAMESFHAFTVTLSSNTPLPPASQWTYSFRPSEP
jgi:hypothetical protein